MTPSDWEAKHPRKSVNLSLEQWERLDGIAAQLAGRTKRGPRIGATSWRVLLQDIADGRLAVAPRYLYSGNVWLRCSDPNCDYEPFEAERMDVLMAGGWLACEHCGKPCIEVQP